MKKAKRIPESEWKWFGNSAHLIVGQWCRFHLATQIGSLIVSTLGEYVPPMGSEREESEWWLKNKPGKDIGRGRKYETMVFVAQKEKCECGCGLPKIDSQELDADTYNEAQKARTGHMLICERVAGGLIQSPCPKPR